MPVGLYCSRVIRERLEEAAQANLQVSLGTETGRYGANHTSRQRGKEGRSEILERPEDTKRFSELSRMTSEGSQAAAERWRTLPNVRPAPPNVAILQSVLIQFRLCFRGQQSSSRGSLSLVDPSMPFGSDVTETPLHRLGRSG
jgi:hypothetical protein